MSYNVIPVTKATPSVRVRAHSDVSVSRSEKRGILTVIMSPALLEVHPELAVGKKVVTGWDSESNMLLIAPAGEQTSNLRKVSKRASWVGAGQVVIPARNLPEDFPHTEEGMKDMHYAEEAGGAIAIQF